MNRNSLDIDPHCYHNMWGSLRNRINMWRFGWLCLMGWNCSNRRGTTLCMYRFVILWCFGLGPGVKSNRRCKLSTLWYWCKSNTMMDTSCIDFPISMGNILYYSPSHTNIASNNTAPHSMTPHTMYKHSSWHTSYNQLSNSCKLTSSYIDSLHIKCQLDNCWMMLMYRS